MYDVRSTMYDVMPDALTVLALINFTKQEVRWQENAYLLLAGLF